LSEIVPPEPATEPVPVMLKPPPPTVLRITPVALPPTDIPALPPMESWVNVRSLGVQGGAVDDTEALQKAISENPVLFFPSGIYHVRSALQLRPDSVLIGLNPNTTAIGLIDGSADFAGEGEPIGVVTAPRDGHNIIVSMGVGTGTRNPRAAAVLWRAGSRSMLDDVTFPGGLGNLNPGGPRGGGPTGPGGAGRGGGGPAAPGGVAPAAARGPAINTRYSQAGDLIIQDGGGGIFRGCWPHDPNAKVGLRVANTSTPGTIYQMSVEHHYRVEAEFHDVRNWNILALQTEEENPDGADAYSIDLQDSSDLLFANTYIYRVSRNIRSKPYAIMARRSQNIALQNVKVFSQTRLAFDNTVLEEGSGIAVRPNFFTSFTINRDMKAPAAVAAPAVFERRAALEKLAGGFSNASGLTVDDKGRIYFTDAAENRIYRWNAADRKAEVLATTTGPQPQVLGFVPPSHLLAIAMIANPAQRTVYHLDLSLPGSGATAVTPTAEMLPGTSLLLPVGLHYQLWVMRDMLAHRGYVLQNGSNTAVISTIENEPRGYYYAPGTTTAIISGGAWRPNIQSSTLAALKPGDSHLLTSEDDGLTYLATLGADYRSLATTLFAHRGGTSVATDTAGNVYIADGHLWIYDRRGRQLGVLETPERVGSLAFGGPDRKTLFIGARSSLYSIRTRSPGAES
jgi:sugar lactone lactonase YvrE